MCSVRSCGNNGYTIVNYSDLNVFICSRILLIELQYRLCPSTHIHERLIVQIKVYGR